MTLPFSVEQFLRVFESYNTAIWPAQIVAYGVGIAAVAFAWHPGPRRGRAVTVALGAYWIWMGVVYHSLFFAAINPAARVFGGFFVIEGGLLIVAGLRPKCLTFRCAANTPGFLGAVFIAYAMILYPLIGSMTGHEYPRVPVFGVAPCPTTIFTLGLLLWAEGGASLYLLPIPVVWSLIGAIAAIELDVPQDYGLSVAGVAGPAVILWRRYRSRRDVDVPESSSRS